MTTFTENPRRALQERLTREARTGRPLTVERLEADGLPDWLAGLIVGRPADMRGPGGIATTVAAFAPAVAEVLGLPDISQRFRPLDRDRPTGGPTR
jgi:hypothetical protein